MTHPNDRKYYDEVLIPQAVKDFEAQAKRILGDDEFNRLKTLYTRARFEAISKRK
jgi:hypothetical protein